MDVTTIEMDPAEAKAKAAELEEHAGMLTEEEQAMLAGYTALATGRPVIDLRRAIAEGGCFDTPEAPPRLAVAKATWDWCYLERYRNGYVRFLSSQSSRPASIGFPAGTLQGDGHVSWSRLRAIVPPIPVGVRARLRVSGAGGWRPCLILWEVPQWERAPRPPGDPLLLRPLAGDLCIVEAQWDLTPLEQAVLSGRVA